MSSALSRGQLTPFQGFVISYRAVSGYVARSSSEVVGYSFHIVMTVIGWVALLGQTWFATGPWNAVLLDWNGNLRS